MIDSEGMGIRGEEFDFITTSPPAVIAKVCKCYLCIDDFIFSFQVILYVGEGSMNTVDLLYDIDDYLSGLNNIVMDSSKKKMCESPNYGYFVVVINKMMGNASD